MKDGPDDIQEYNLAAERLYRNLKDTGHLMIRPVSDLQRTALYFYRVGIILSGLDVGFHTVLDFGSGSCWLALILNRLGAQPICLDVSKTALNLGKKLFKRQPDLRKDRYPRFIQYDGIKFPLDDHSVDRIISFDSFHHIANRATVLKEMYRVLREGGRVGLSEPSLSLNESEAAIQEMETKNVVEDGVDASELEKHAHEAGFSQVFWKPFPKPERVFMDESGFKGFMGGNDKAYPLHAIREDQNFLLFAFLQKGRYEPDTRKPNDLRARIELLDGNLEAAPKSKIIHRLILTNVGDTTWLHQSELEGEVILEGRFFAEGKTDLILKPFVAVLPQSVKSRENIIVEITVESPKKRGVYRLQYDLRIKGRFQFSDVNMNPHKSDALNLTFKVV